MALSCCKKVALFRGVTSKHDEDFYKHTALDFTFFQCSIDQTKNKLNYYRGKD